MYLFSARFAQGNGPIEGTDEHAIEMDDWDALNAALSQSGDLVWSLALTDARTGVVVASDSGEEPTRRVPDPADEGVFALYLLDVADEAAALGWAERMPACRYGSVDVREVLSRQEEDRP